MKKKVLYEGSPKPSEQHIGTSRQPRIRRDRWGTIPAGGVRTCRVDLENGRGEHIGQLSVPISWFGQKTKMKLKIIAEVT